MCWMQVSFIQGEESMIDCLDGSFSGMAGNSPVRHWKGVTTEGRKEGAAPRGPTYERHCLRGHRHDGRDEIHKNG